MTIEQKGERGRESQPFAWLYTVLGVSVVTFLLEYGVAQYANSGALQADCGHLFMDVVLYSQVVIAEHFKGIDFVKRNPRMVAMLDLFGGFLAIALLIVNSYVVVLKATQRLDGTDYHNPSERLRQPHGFFSYVWSTLAHDHDHDEVNERLVFAFCAGALPINIAIACVGYSYVSSNNDTWLDAIHSIVHPGCNDFHVHDTSRGAGLTKAFSKDCGTDNCADCLERTGRDDDSVARRPRRRPTFNLVTVWVHITTDIMKDAVLLTASILMMFKTVERQRADAVTAMIIVSLIAIGAVWTLPAICNSMKIAIWGAGADLESSSEGDDEEQRSLLDRDRSRSRSPGARSPGARRNQ